jgi:hypothetical protein
MKRLVVLFALAGLSIASAKTYTVLIGEPAVVGNVQLKAGHYKVNIEGAKATLTSVASKKEAIEATGAAGTADKKFKETVVQLSKDSSGQIRLREIDFGGTSTKVEFNQ